jgi:hypothetical protein
MVSMEQAAAAQVIGLTPRRMDQAARMIQRFWRRYQVRLIQRHQGSRSNRKPTRSIHRCAKSVGCRSGFRLPVASVLPSRWAAAVIGVRPGCSAGAQDPSPPRWPALSAHRCGPTGLTAAVRRPHPCPRVARHHGCRNVIRSTHRCPACGPQTPMQQRSCPGSAARVPPRLRWPRPHCRAAERAASAYMRVPLPLRGKIPPDAPSHTLPTCRFRRARPGVDWQSGPVPCVRRVPADRRRFGLAAAAG